MIQDLHRWWAIRYPGFPSANLVGLAFSPVKFKVPPIEGPKSDFYQLSLEEMDELFASIVLLDWSLYTNKPSGECTMR